MSASVPNADEKGLYLTLYVFHTTNSTPVAFFVRMCVQYNNLHKLGLSWGIEAFCGVLGHGIEGAALTGCWQTRCGIFVVIFRTQCSALRIKLTD